MEKLETGYFYYIYNRGNNKERIFKETENYKHFMRLLNKHIEPVADIYSYCLLPNHFHLLIQTKIPDNFQNNEINYSKKFSNLFNAYTKSINKKYNRVGSLFQKPFRRKKIDNEDYLRELIIYINTNSSKHFYADYLTYPYSSYHTIVNEEDEKMTEFIKHYFDDIANFKHLLKIKKDRIESDDDFV